MLISADFAPIAAFYRPNTDADGNKAPTALGENPVVVSEHTRQVFIPRVAVARDPSDPEIGLRAGDQFDFAGGKFTLAGRARGDMNHPMTGDDLGWVAFDIEFGWLGGSSATAAGRGVVGSGGGRSA